MFGSPDNRVKDLEQNLQNQELHTFILPLLLPYSVQLQHSEGSDTFSVYWVIVVMFRYSVQLQHPGGSDTFSVY